MTTFYEFQKQFPDDEACLKRIMLERYGGTEFSCPKCGVHSKFYRMNRERAYVCQHCKYQLHPTAGTFMHRTHLPLHKWFYAMHLFANSRHGVAAKELERQLGIPYKTAWRMAHEIRKYMAEVDVAPLDLQNNMDRCPYADCVGSEMIALTLMISASNSRRNEQSCASPRERNSWPGYL